MSALLAYDGPIVHVDHTHRVVAPTGATTNYGPDGRSYYVYDKDERVLYIDRNGDKHDAVVINVDVLDKHGTPYGYTVKVTNDDGSGEGKLVDTTESHMQPIEMTTHAEADKHATAYSVRGGGGRFRLSGSQILARHARLPIPVYDP
tara:strand:- start:364 stop:804 length:441 start_codon:yes stop_codon:yes gene_type:complete